LGNRSWVGGSKHCWEGRDTEWSGVGLVSRLIEDAEEMANDVSSQLICDLFERCEFTIGQDPVKMIFDA